MRTTKSKGDGGFTLIEVIVALFVLAVVMLAILFVQARALTTNADSQGRQAATAAANEAMEALRAMPWNYLRKGLYSGWNTSATDPFVSGGNTITVDGKNYTLRVGSAGSDQDLSQPWLPLFDGAGRNVQTLDSGSGNGDTITIRAYTTEDQTGQAAAVGLLVVATWDKRIDGSTEHTVITSTAYAPSAGCGDLNNAPFLASCQAQFDATSSSARLEIAATATSLDGATAQPLLDGLAFYSFQVSTGTAATQVTSQQVSNTSAFASLGGTQWDDDVNTTSPGVNGWTRGLTGYSVRASDDTTAGAEPPNPASITGTGANSTYSFSSGDFTLGARSDDVRSGTVTAKTTTACGTGLAFSVTAGAPCASSLVGGTSSSVPYMTLGVNGKDLQLANVTGSTSSVYDQAWAARFVDVAGNPSVGCTVVSGTGAGCTSAGSQQGFGTVVIGDVKHTGNWDGLANLGLVRITGYQDSVRVERGENNQATAPTLSRSATISYFNGLIYTPIAVGTNTAGTWTVPTATWTTADAVIEASGTILVTGAATTTDSTTNCIGGDGCIVDAVNGTITVTITYEITPTDGSVTPWALTVKTTLNGSQAGARFEESPNA